MAIETLTRPLWAVFSFVNTSQAIGEPAEIQSPMSRFCHNHQFDRTSRVVERLNHQTAWFVLSLVKGTTVDFSLRDSFVVVFCLLMPVSISRADVSPIEIEFSSPDAISFDRANLGMLKLTLSIENTSNDAVVMWPYFSGYLVDSTGKLQKQDKRIGRWGRLSSPSVLEAFKFIKLKPGEKLELKVSINRFDYDPDVITGWRVPKPGDYQFVLRCHFNREYMKKKYGDGCKGIDDESKPWNQALEIDQTARVDFVVKR